MVDNNDVQRARIIFAQDIIYKKGLAFEFMALWSFIGWYAQRTNIYDWYNAFSVQV